MVSLLKTAKLPNIESKYKRQEGKVRGSYLGGEVSRDRPVSLSREPVLSSSPGSRIGWNIELVRTL